MGMVSGKWKRELISIIESEGLDYTFNDYLGGDRIEKNDPRLAEKVQRFIDARNEITRYLRSNYDADFEV